LPGIQTARNVMKLGWDENYYEFNPLTLRAAGPTSDETSCHGAHDLYQQMPDGVLGSKLSRKLTKAIPYALRSAMAKRSPDPIPN
jgi:hypothetical protein